MYEIIDAIKYWILHKFEIPEVKVEENRDEILYLRNELTIAREEISRLTNLMYNASVKPELSDKVEEDPEPIRAQYIPWHLRREKLERDSRIKAESLRKEALVNKVQVNIIKPEPVKSVEDLENELEVKSNDAISRG